MDNLLLPGIIVGSILVIGTALKYKNNYKNMLDAVNPSLSHRVGDTYFGGRKTKHRRDKKHRKSNKSRRK
jgi:hypothetical protein